MSNQLDLNIRYNCHCIMSDNVCVVFYKHFTISYCDAIKLVRKVGTEASCDCFNKGKHAEGRTWARSFQINSVYTIQSLDSENTEIRQIRLGACTAEHQNKIYICECMFTQVHTHSYTVICMHGHVNKANNHVSAAIIKVYVKTAL